jgi:hypothetical protein
MYYTLQIHNQLAKSKQISTKKIKRLYHFIHSHPENDSTTYFLRVSYGQAVDSQGDRARFENEGEYSQKQDLIYALQCFTEDK